MGVEYRHYLIPRPNSLRPDSKQLAEFVTSLAVDRWIAAPRSEALRRWAAIEAKSEEEFTDGWAYLRLRPGFAAVPRSLTVDWFQAQMSRDLELGFPVEHADQLDLQYPLVSDGGLPEDPYYEIQIHLSPEYVHHASELIEPAETACACGQSLEYYPDRNIFYASRIKTRCPRCRKEFDPSSLQVVVRDGWTGERSVVTGGAIYRFSVVIDCGKCIPERKHAPIRANPELVALCRKAFGHEFYEIGDIY
jgi:hypothetical protein